MACRFGLEESRGLASGSLVSAESLQYQKMADNLCAQGKPNEAAPFMFMLKAWRTRTMWIHSPPLLLCIKIIVKLWKYWRMENCESSLESKYGPDAFKDGGLVGQFNEVMNMRPYMCLLQAIVRVAVECKNHPSTQGRNSVLPPGRELYTPQEQEKMDLWLEEDVWNWVHANSDAQQAVRRIVPGLIVGENSRVLVRYRGHQG
ncbi:hypothetical protein EV368DRAFT_69906 [Lentinula lateritia]|nr:hypothetical protein EV368DRAFT_69906 [Lentinula lateritia]